MTRVFRKQGQRTQFSEEGFGGDHLRVLDLFSGIGGFSLGLERTGGFQTVAFCEINPFCRQVLAKHWPEVPCHDDVETYDFKEGEADVITAGFPCQDISVAGRGAGLAGSRSGLYRHVIRAIRLVRPKFALLENVAALLGRGLGTVLGDLAEIGHDTEWHCIPASAVGAPHRRDRVWIVAHPECARREGLVSNHGVLGGARAPLAITLHDAFVDRVALEQDRFSIRDGHGVSVRMDRRRLGQCGNTVVPQIPELIGNAILASIAQAEAA